MQVDALTMQVDALTMQVDALTMQADALTMQDDALTMQADALTMQVDAIALSVMLRLINPHPRRVDARCYNGGNLRNALARLYEQSPPAWAEILIGC